MKTVLKLMGVAILCVGFVNGAMAKDAFGLLQQIEGPQMITTTWNDIHTGCAPTLSADNKNVAGSKSLKKKPDAVKCKPVTTSEVVEFAYVGGTELWLIRPTGREAAFIPGFGSQNIEWSDDKGHRYQIGTSEGTSVEGSVFFNKAIVGSFVMKKVRLAQHPLDGRWSGQMGFPGGFLYSINLMSSGTVRPMWDNCGLLSARMEFSDAPYANIDVVICADEKTGEESYSMAMLYWDMTTNNTWFLTFDGFMESGALQGSVTAMPLFGGENHVGAFIVLPPQPFLETPEED